MATRAVALDVGSNTVKVMEVKAGKHGLVVTGYASLPREEADAIGRVGIGLKGLVAGVGGRDMILRYTQVPPSPDWQLKNLMELELADLQSQSGGELSADYNLIPVQDEESGLETVLMALARNEALARVSDLVRGAGGSIEAHVPMCIALYNAFVKCGPVVEEDEVCGLVAIGRETMDLALVRGTELLFARNLSTGGKVLDDAIAGAFNVSERKAEQLKIDFIDLDPGSRGRFASGQAEKVTMAAGGAASAIVAGIQSSVAFCESQTKIQGLRLDKLWVCGGSANVRGLKGMLRDALRCPVELFDPFERCDLSTLPADQAELLAGQRQEAVLALGLAAGRVDTGLYSLEILPEHVKRRQRFVQRTVFDLAAIAIAVALLAAYFVTSKARLEAATGEKRRVESQVKAIEAVNREATTLQEDVTRRRALIEALAARAIPLDGTLRVIHALQETLPPELWIESIEVKNKPGERSVRGVTSEPRQIVQVKGKGKEVSGVAVGDVYQAFAKKFVEHKLIPAVVAVPKHGVDGITEFTFDIDVMPAPEVAAGNPQGKQEE